MRSGRLRGLTYDLYRMRTTSDQSTPCQGTGVGNVQELWEALDRAVVAGTLAHEAAAGRYVVGSHMTKSRPSSRKIMLEIKGESSGGIAPEKDSMRRFLKIEVSDVLQFIARWSKHTSSDSLPKVQYIVQEEPMEIFTAADKDLVRSVGQRLLKSYETHLLASG